MKVQIVSMSEKSNCHRCNYPSYREVLSKKGKSESSSSHCKDVENISLGRANNNKRLNSTKDSLDNTNIVNLTPDSILDSCIFMF